jgi:uncharacterized delta-60 repeat protein
LRFNDDGSLDKTYGDNGLAEGDPKAFSPSSYAMDHKTGALYLGGSTTGFSNTAVARITPDGRIDGQFGEAGITRPPLKRSDGLAQQGVIAIAPTGAIYVAQFEQHFDGRYGVAVWRLRANGSPDTSFGNGGGVLTTAVFDVRGALVQPDGKVVVGGNTSSTVTRDGHTYYVQHLALVRMLTTGALDQGYGSSGRVDGGPSNGAAISLQGSQTLVGGDLEHICSTIDEGDAYYRCAPIGPPPEIAVGFRIARYNG